MSFTSLTRSGYREGGFEKGIDHKKFSVVLVLKKGLVCLSDIGDRSKFCLKINFPWFHPGRPRSLTQ